MAFAPDIWKLKTVGGLSSDPIEGKVTARYDDALALAMANKEPVLILLGNELVATWTPELGEEVINPTLRGKKAR